MEKEVLNQEKVHVNYGNFTREQGEVTAENHITHWTKSIEEFKKAAGAAKIRVLDTKTKDGKEGYAALLINEKGESGDIWINFSKALRAKNERREFQIQYRTGMDKEGTITNYYYAVAIGTGTAIDL